MNMRMHTPQVLWDAVPQFLRKLDSTLEVTIGKRLPINAAPVWCVRACACVCVHARSSVCWSMCEGARLDLTAYASSPHFISFASWMGGDRDGNPFVTPHITRTVALRARWQALRLLIRDIRKLKMALSSTKCSDELRRVVGP